MTTINVQLSQILKQYDSVILNPPAAVPSTVVVHLGAAYQAGQPIKVLNATASTGLDHAPLATVPIPPPNTNDVIAIIMPPGTVLPPFIVTLPAGYIPGQPIQIIVDGVQSPPT